MKESSLTTIALVPLLMAAFSLVSMIGLLQIDKLVHGTLYSYGLEFNYLWAQPYWRMTALIFVMGWFNIIAALAFQVYIITFERRQARRFADAVRDEVMRTRIRAVEMIRETRREDTVPGPALTTEATEQKTSEAETVVQQDSSEEAQASSPTDRDGEPAEQPEEQQTQPEAEQSETKPEITEKKEEPPIIVGIPAEELNASR